MIGAVREMLLPHTTVLVVSSLAARRLATDEPDEQDGMSMDEAALRIRQFGCEFVLVTGTHEQTPTINNGLFNRSGRARQDSWERLPGSFHGAGTTLSSAVAAFIANGMDIPQAAREAQDYTWNALKHAYRPGMGQSVPDRLFWARPKPEDEGSAAED
jgi:hydroxymethylpyrimidine/phosphomethylpyrimidine kinase